MTNRSVRWGLALGAAVMAEITLILLSIIVVAVYSYAIHTGETPEFYSEFAKVSGPWVSLVTGGPVFFLIARWIRRRAGSAALGTAMALAGFYLAIETIFLLLWPGDIGATLPFAIGGFLLKFAGACLGASGIATGTLAKTA